MNFNDIKKLNAPVAPGCYQFYNAQGKIIYIGKAANLKNRVLSYWQKSANHTPVKNKMLSKIVKIKWVETESEIEALLLESNLVKKYQPEYNVLLRDDKRFVYIKISTEDEIPGVFVTRKIDKTGRYFGPFPSALAARGTVRAVRKIWPYCTERKIKNKPCFYYQLSRCLGVCADKISREEYIKRVIKPLMLFFEGKKKNIVKKLEARIKKLELCIKYNVSSIKYQDKKAKNNEFFKTKYLILDTKYKNVIDEINFLKYQLKNIKQVLVSARILSVHEKYANDAVELAKLLSLPKIPERIEGYDIANIFGREAVGSMAVFSSGEPDKNEYRKFKIKLGQGQANDVGMLEEVLERRFNNNWLMPDLIVVDGGKAQLNAAGRVLKKFSLAIPIIAISKGAGLRSAAALDKLFFPGETKPLELPLASPALHLIKRVRDEAHRFAIGYHRKLRSRAKFG